MDCFLLYSVRSSASDQSQLQQQVDAIHVGRPHLPLRHRWLAVLCGHDLSVSRSEIGGAPFRSELCLHKTTASHIQPMATSNPWATRSGCEP
jgi:hypothetical protein